MKTLFLVREVPFPTVGGVGLRNWQNITLLAQWGEVALFSLYRQAVDPYPIPPVTRWHHVALPPPPGGWRGKFWRRWMTLRPGFPHGDALWNRAAAIALEQWARDFQPHLVVVEELWFYPYLAQIQRWGVPVILDHHNLEFQLAQDLNRALAMPKWPGQAGLRRWRCQRLRHWEQHWGQRVDQNWVCSQGDRDGLDRGQVPTWVIPNGIDVAAYEGVRLGQVAPLPPDGAPTVVFMGSLAYEPNVEAVRFLLEQVYPHLRRRRPDCRVLIVGRTPRNWMWAAAQENPQIVVTGTVPDVRPYLAAAQVMVVPLMQGGGTRLKILEAFAAGRAVVSTAKGAEGIAAVDGQHLLLREEGEAMAAAVVALWEDPGLYQALTAAALDLVQQTYSREAIAQPIHQALTQLGFALPPPRHS